MRCAPRRGPKNESAIPNGLWRFALDGFVARDAGTHSPCNESLPDEVFGLRHVRGPVATRGLAYGSCVNAGLGCRMAAGPDSLRAATERHREHGRPRLG